MVIESIKNETEYDDGLARAYDLMQLDLVLDSKEYKELELLGRIIEEYEKVHYKICFE